VERVYIRRLNSVGAKYVVKLNLSKALDEKIMRKLAEVKSLYPKASKHGIVLGSIEKGLKYLTKNTLVPHLRERGKPYVEIHVAISDVSEIDDLAKRFQASTAEIVYNALIRGIEHG
jgi:hypothetical protein